MIILIRIHVILYDIRHLENSKYLYKIETVEDHIREVMFYVYKTQ